ncbi:uncharacterized protein LOC125548935 [Triticum urartu]|uniref:uncharacterized protein LOC125548935 n=1 Tax=Triticum urartu TaxID=4572 RepID=UPI002042E4BF|nr:uncharacterized protein LOC125548935 [Triticum urartu]
MDMRALNLKAAGPSFLAPRRHPPATWAPLPAGEIGRRRQPARLTKLAVSASGKKSRNGRDGDDPKSKPSPSGKGDASTPIGDDDADAVSQNHGELKPSDTMYVPSNLSYWRDVRASFVIPKSVSPILLD